MPLGLYLGVLALTSVCMYMGCVPKSLVPAFLVLMEMCIRDRNQAKAW